MEQTLPPVEAWRAQPPLRAVLNEVLGSREADVLAHLACRQNVVAKDVRNVRSAHPECTADEAVENRGNRMTADSGGHQHARPGGVSQPLATREVLHLLPGTTSRDAADSTQCSQRHRIASAAAQSSGLSMLTDSDEGRMSGRQSLP